MTDWNKEDWKRTHDMGPIKGHKVTPNHDVPFTESEARDAKKELELFVEAAEHGKIGEIKSLYPKRNTGTVGVWLEPTSKTHPKDIKIDVPGWEATGINAKGTDKAYVTFKMDIRARRDRKVFQEKPDDLDVDESIQYTEEIDDWYRSAYKKRMGRA